ncbi:hypothetical protein ACFFGT_24865 [Mucilaginibacter angelicae]|uniref:VCBS repeat-containing protein n=1 Tax=Mucilaginibacter angelicae TaxID=869718 RepID=A0ABV6LDB8_9SPHI
MFICFSCGQKTPPANKPPVPRKTHSVNQVASSEGSVAYYPSDSVSYPARILSGYGLFHGGEVALDWGKYHWKGLFKSAGGYYVASTSLIINRAHDDMLDDKGQATGVEVRKSVKDSVLILFSGITGITNRPVEQINVKVTELLPGQYARFTNNNIAYTLYATGNRKYDIATKDYVITNYRLFIKAVINGKKIDQLLASAPRFDDALTQILFVGDIDGDEVPDLILDTTNDYNVEQPTLYLSKPATNGNLLKIMGLHVITGC